MARRTPVIAGNWKMNLSQKEGGELVRALRSVRASEGAEVWVAPSFPVLPAAIEAAKGSAVRVAAQNMHWEASGAYTGEVAASQLVDVGASGVILGHSERRKLFGETDEQIKKKLRAAILAKLTPILCIGELLEEREKNQTFAVLDRQMTGALAGIGPSELSGLIIAYEPVWAIGTGKTATPAQAQEAHQFTRKMAEKIAGKEFAEKVRILYGGSVTPENIDLLMAQSEVDGALVGGASLKAPSFTRIMQFQAAAKYGAAV